MADKAKATEEQKDQEPSSAEVFDPEVSDRRVTEGKTKKQPEKAIKAGVKLTKIIEEIEKLSVLELAELVKALEDKFGVSAASPMAVAASPAAQAAALPAVEEKSEFDVVLTSAGANKIGVIKAVREIKPDLGLKEAKDIADAPPKEILTGVNKETAQEAKTKLETAGAKVELK